MTATTEGNNRNSFMKMCNRRYRSVVQIFFMLYGSILFRNQFPSNILHLSEASFLDWYFAIISLTVRSTLKSNDLMLSFTVSEAWSFSRSPYLSYASIATSSIEHNPQSFSMSCQRGFDDENILIEVPFFSEAKRQESWKPMGYGVSLSYAKTQLAATWSAL